MEMPDMSDIITGYDLVEQRRALTRIEIRQEEILRQMNRLFGKLHTLQEDVRVKPKVHNKPKSKGGPRQ